MGFYLNSRNSYEDYLEMVSDPYFVDKSELMKELIPSIGRKSKYICITRPRRFGKSVMANMIAAFLGKAVDSSSLFGQLKIAEGKEEKDISDYHKHLNQHNVIYIDFSEVPRNCSDYRQYIDRIQDGINQDLAEAYPDIGIRTSDTVWDVMTRIFQKTGEKFVFVVDEWDAVFHMPYITESNLKDYLLFIKSLLKGESVCGARIYDRRTSDCKIFQRVRVKYVCGI